MLAQLVHTKIDIIAPRFQDYKLGDNVYPLILRFTFGHSYLAGMSPRRELTIISHFSRAKGSLCFSTYTIDMKECDAPESISTIVEVSLTKKHTNDHVCSFLGFLHNNMIDLPTNIVLLGSNRNTTI
jgi:hypothetical protein